MSESPIIIKIKLPKSFMNIAITKDNFLIADTNDTKNWDDLKFPLPEGEWVVESHKNKNLELRKIS